MLFDFISSLLGAPSSGWEGATDADRDSAMGNYMATLGAAFSQAARGGTLGQALTQGIQQGRSVYSDTMDRYEQRRQAEAAERRANSQEQRLTNADTRAGEKHDAEIAEVERMNQVFSEIDSVLTGIPADRADDIKLAFQLRDTQTAFNLLGKERELNPQLRQALRDETLKDWQAQLEAGMVVSADRVQDENERHNKEIENVNLMNAETARAGQELASADRAVGHMIGLITSQGDKPLTQAQLMAIAEERRKAWHGNMLNQMKVREGAQEPDFMQEAIDDYERAKKLLGGSGGAPVETLSADAKLEQMLDMAGLQGPEREAEKARLLAKGEAWIHGAWKTVQGQ